MRGEVEKMKAEHETWGEEKEGEKSEKTIT